MAKKEQDNGLPSIEPLRGRESSELERRDKPLGPPVKVDGDKPPEPDPEFLDEETE